MMAEGGESPTQPQNPWLQEDKEPSSIPLRRQISEEEVTQQSRGIVEQFIHDRFEEDGLETPPVETFHDASSPTGPSIDPEVKHNIAKYLKAIGDQLDRDAQLRKLTEKLDDQGDMRTTFFSICSEVFKDGQFNWGRVAAVFHFAYKLAVKSLRKIPVIRSIIDWTVEVIRRYAAPWIASRGGWNSITEYFGSSDLQFAGTFVGFIGLLAFIIYYWRKN